MKIGIVASTMIAGMLWIAVMQVNNTMFTNVGRQTIQESVKVRTDALSRLIDLDLRRAGFGVEGHGIITADSTGFSFESDFENDGVIRTVTWELDTETLQDGRDEIILIRTVDGDSIDYRVGAIEFFFVYYDEEDQPTENLDDVRHIGYLLLAEASQAYGNRFERHAITRKVSPVNLAIKQ